MNTEEQWAFEQEMVELSKRLEAATNTGDRTLCAELNTAILDRVDTLRELRLMPLTPDLIVEHAAGVRCLTPEELRAGARVTRIVSFVPEVLVGSGDEDLFWKVIFWMHPFTYFLPPWQPEQPEVTRLESLDELGNPEVQITFIPKEQAHDGS